MFQDGGSELILLSLEDVDADQPLFSLVKPAATLTLKDSDKFAEMISDSVKRWLETGARNDLFSSRQVIHIIIFSIYNTYIVLEKNHI